MALLDLIKALKRSSLLYKSRNHWVTYKLCQVHNIKKSVAEWTARDQRLHTQRARESATWAGGLRPSVSSSSVLLRNCILSPLSSEVRASESTRRPSPLSCPLPKRERESEAWVDVTTPLSSALWQMYRSRV